MSLEPPDPKERPARATGLRRYAGNALSLVTTAGALRASSFVMYALIARYLGAFALGQVSLAVTLHLLFSELAVPGLSTFITRQVAQDRSKTGMYLTNAALVVFVCSAASMLLLAAFVTVMRYEADTSRVILLVSLGLLPYGLSKVFESIFQAWEVMHYIAYVNAPVSLAKVGLTFAVLQAGYGAPGIAFVLIGCFVATALVEIVLVARYAAGQSRRLDVRFSASMVRSATPFLGIRFANSIKSSLGTILLSAIAGETAVGLLNAATQLMSPFRLVYNNLANSFFPVMCRRFTAGVTGLRRITQDLIAFILAITFPAMVGLFVLAGPVLVLLYGGQEFLGSQTVLRIIVWLPLLDTVTTVFGQTLWASGKEMVDFRITIINTAVKLAAGLVLIESYGLLGAAIVAALVSVVDLVQHYIPVARLFSGFGLLSLYWKPAAAAACMTVIFVFVARHGLVQAVTAAALLYCVVLLALLVVSAGGFRQFKRRYLYPWS